MERVVIESLREGTLYASVSVEAGGESQEVDARPSDAVNLAVRLAAPLFVAAELVDQWGVIYDAERLRAEGKGEWRPVLEVTGGDVGGLYDPSSVQSARATGDSRPSRQAGE